MGVFDFPVEKDPPEASTTSAEQQNGEGDAQESGEDSRARGAADNAPDPKVAELERKLAAHEDRLLDLMAQNAALRTTAKGESNQPEKKRYTPEELKSWSEGQGGKVQLDAAILYADQTKEDVLNQVRAELRQEKTQQFIRQYMIEVYPALADEGSEFSKSVEREQKRLLASGEVDATLPDAQVTAYNMALHRVGRTLATAPKGGEEPKEVYSARRRHEESGAEPTPRSSPEGKGSSSSKLSDEEVRVARAMGLDLSKPETMARFKKLQTHYANARRSMP